MHFIFHFVCICVSLLHSINADDFTAVKIDSKMSFISIHRDVDPSIIASTTNATSLLACSAHCTLQHDTTSLYFVKEDRTCHCNNNTDLSDDYDSNKPKIIYAYLDHLVKIFKDGDISKWQWKPLKSDCLELYSAGFSADGVYTIQATGQDPVDVWCDMQNGGWTVFQRRLDGSEDFYRGWSDYVSGFGNRTGEYWLGLDNIHALTLQASELYIYAEAFEGKSPPSAHAQYMSFAVEGHLQNYILRVDGFTGSCNAEALRFANNMPFSTFDRNHGTRKNNCAKDFRGAWWYSGCHIMNLNGYYYGGEHDTFADGVNWKDCWGYQYSVQKTIMKVRQK